MNSRQPEYHSNDTQFGIFTIHLPLVKKAFSFLLGLHILFTGFLHDQSAAELSRLPGLVHHFFHHTVEEQEQITFIDFLVLHYGDSNHAHEENHEDLPLFHNICSCLLYVHTEQHIAFAAYEDPQPHNLSGYFNNYSHESTTVIFQPPKFA